MFSKKFVAATRALSEYDSPVAAPLMRRSFDVSGDVSSAKLTMTGLGFYELYLNGKRITRGYLAPYISNPDDNIYYDEYDLKAGLRPGKNTLGIMLGNGMQDCFAGHIWDFQLAAWRGSPRTAFALELSDAAGERVIEADAQVRTAESAIYLNDLRAGEFYDARREIPGWNLPEFDDSAWKPALEVDAPRGECRIGIHEPITIEREIKPVEIRRSRISGLPCHNSTMPEVHSPEDEKRLDGWLFDFGENNAGLCRLRVKGERGQKIILQFGEVLNPDGGLNLWTMQFMPLTFDQRDIYILKGDPDGEEFTPHFTYHGFRYCLAIGITDAQATPDALTYLVMHTELKPRGYFNCSDDITNKLWEATQRSNVSNFFYFPTDCPHREKNGWTGDASVSSEQFMLSMSAENSLKEWLNNIRKAQLADGSLPGIIPTGGWGYKWGNGPAWDAVIVNLPYFIWKYRGDEQVIRENATAIMRYLDYIYGRRDENGLIHVGLGDWCQAGHIDDPFAPLEVTDTLMVMDMLHKSAQMFRAVGMAERAGYADALYANVRAAGRKFLIDAATMTAKGDCQCSQAMAIFYDLFDEAEKPAAIRALVERIHKDDDLITVGILGTRTMFEVLSDNGYADLAYELITTTRFPSFGFWIAQGDTTLVESFQPDNSEPVSHNHHFFGHISAWFMRALAGILVNPHMNDATGIDIAPKFVDRLNDVECWHDSAAGRICVHWKRAGDGIKLTLDVPAQAHGCIKLSDGWKFIDGTTGKALATGEYVLVK